MIRRPDVWLGGRSLLDVLRSGEMERIRDYFDRLFSYIPERADSSQKVVKLIFGTTDVIRIHNAIVERRVKPTALTRAMRVLDLDRKLLARVLYVSVGAVSRRPLHKGSLSVHDAACLYRLARIADLASAMFGDYRRALRWLTKSIPALRGASPIDLLSTELSGREVERVLYQDRTSWEPRTVLKQQPDASRRRKLK